jgi:hypothetical protein
MQITALSMATSCTMSAILTHIAEPSQILLTVP